MTLPSNPYIAGDPVSGQTRFIGRADVLHALHNPNVNDAGFPNWYLTFSSTHKNRGTQ